MTSEQGWIVMGIMAGTIAGSCLIAQIYIIWKAQYDRRKETEQRALEVEIHVAETEASIARGARPHRQFIKPSSSVSHHVSKSLGYDQNGNNHYLLHPDDRDFINRIGVDVVDCDKICPDCGCSYLVHPPVQGALWATRVCDRSERGRIVKCH